MDAVELLWRQRFAGAGENYVHFYRQSHDQGAVLLGYLNFELS